MGLIKEIICDFCGKDMSHDYYKNHLETTLRYWHGGSCGGKEDEDKIDLWLCEDCAEKLSRYLNEMTDVDDWKMNM